MKTIPDEIRARRETVLPRTGYTYLLVDDSLQCPFQINDAMVRISRQVFSPIADPERRARTIFDYIETRIPYGATRRPAGYRSSREVLSIREGVCGEMAFLYVTLARLSRLQSMYVRVHTDEKGEAVNHACAGVNLGRLVLADVAYHRFDARHRKFEIRTDEQMMRDYASWR